MPPPKSPSPQQGLKGAVKQAGKVAMDAANRMLGSAVEPKRRAVQPWRRASPLRPTPWPAASLALRLCALHWP